MYGLFCSLGTCHTMVHDYMYVISASFRLHSHENKATVGCLLDAHEMLAWLSTKRKAVVECLVAQSESLYP